MPYIDLTPEQQANYLKGIGADPQRDRLVPTEDGKLMLRRNAIEPSTVMGTLARGIGHEAPRALAAAAGAGAAGAIGAPVAAMTGPFAPVTEAAIGLGGAVLGGLGYEGTANFFKSPQDQAVEQAQAAADAQAHPIAAPAGRLLGSFIAFRPKISQAKDLYSAVQGLRSGAQLAPEAVAALKQAAIATGATAAPEAYRLATQEQPISGYDVGEAAARTALAPVTGSTWLGKAAEGAGRLGAQLPKAAVKGIVAPREPNIQDVTLPSWGTMGTEAQENPLVRDAMANFPAEERRMRGVSAEAISGLSKYPKDVLDAAIKRLNSEMLTGKGRLDPENKTLLGEGTKLSNEGQPDAQPTTAIGESRPASEPSPQATPETPEYRDVKAIWMKAMHEYADRNNAVTQGRPINKTDAYVPHHMSQEFQQALAADKNPTQATLRNAIADTVLYNNNIYKANGWDFDPTHAMEYANGIFTAASRGEGVGDFNAANRAERPYWLPEHLREHDPRAIMARYGQRMSREIARKAAIDQHPVAGPLFGMSADGNGPQMHTVHNKAEQAVHGAIYGELAQPKKSGRDVMETVEALQGAATAGPVGTATALRNLPQGFKDNFLHTEHIGDVVNAFAAHSRLVTDYKRLYNEAVASGSLHPNVGTHTLPEEHQFQSSLAKKIRSMWSDPVRKLSLGNKLESIGRIANFAVGERAAERYLPRHLANPTGDEAANTWVNKFGAGLDPKTMTIKEMVRRMAGNYTTALQTSYSPEGLPAALVRPGPVRFLGKLNRFSVEHANRTHDALVSSLERRQYLPLLTYSLGTAMSAGAVMALNKALTGVDASRPTFKEIDTEKDRGHRRQDQLKRILQIANAGNAMGIISGWADNFGANTQGQGRQYQGDVLSGVGLALGMTVAKYKDALDKGIPHQDAFLDALEHGLSTYFQDARPVMRAYDVLANKGAETQKRADLRDRRVYEYTSGQKPVTASEQALSSLGLRGLDQQATPGRSRLFDRVAQGDPQAFGSVLASSKPQDVKGSLRRSLDYPGLPPLGTRDKQSLMNLKGQLDFVEQTQGPEAKAALLQRARTYIQERAQGTGRAASNYWADRRSRAQATVPVQ